MNSQELYSFLLFLSVMTELDSMAPVLEWVSLCLYKQKGNKIWKYIQSK